MASRQAPKVGLDPDVAAAIEQVARQFGGNRTVAVNWLLRKALGLIPETLELPSPTIQPPAVQTSPPTETPESNVTLLSKAERFKRMQV